MSGTIDLGDDWQVVGNDGGDTTVEHTPTGNTFTLQSDGTLDTPAVTTVDETTKTRPVVDVTYFGAVGDGSTSDDAAIRDAFDHAAAVGAGAVLFPGTGAAEASSETPASTEYMMDPSNGAIEPPEGINVVGASRDVALVHEDPTAGGTFFSVPEGHVGTTFRDFTVDMRGDVGGNGVCVEDKGERTLIDNLRLLDSAALAVQFRGAKYSTIQNCEVRDVYSGSYIGMIGLRNGFGTCTGVRVLNNHIYMTADPSQNQAGVGLSTAEETLIAFNYIHDTNSSGVRSEDGNGNTNRNTVAFNYIRGVAVSGIDMGPLDGPVEQYIAFNFIENIPRAGIIISHDRSTVRGNFIKNTGTSGSSEGPGINVLAPHAVVAENTVLACDPIGIQSSEPTAKVVRNYVDGVGDADAILGINARDGTGGGHTLLGNVARRTQKSGIITESGAPGLVKNNYVEDCGLDSGGTESDGAGIKSVADGSVFVDNAVRGSRTVSLVPSQDDVVVDNHLPNGIQGAALDRPTHMYGNHPTVISDVRDRAAEEANHGYHNGAGSNTAGPAFYDGSGWVSLVDGSSIT